MKVLGIREVNYKSQKTGKDVHGYEVYGSFPSKQCLFGERVGSEYLSAALIERKGGELPDLGDELTVTFNRQGNVADYTIIKSM